MAKLAAEHTYTPAEELTLWKEARVFASQNKSYTIRGKSYTRQDLDVINRMIVQLTREIAGAAGQLSTVIGQHARRV